MQLPPRPEPGTGTPGRTTGAVLTICPVPAHVGPASAVSRHHPVGLLCAAYVMNRPVHGHSRTNGSLSVPASLQRPRENGSSDPCPAHTRVAKLFMGTRIPRGSPAFSLTNSKRTPNQQKDPGPCPINDPGEVSDESYPHRKTESPGALAGPARPGHRPAHRRSRGPRVPGRARRLRPATSPSATGWTRTTRAGGGRARDRGGTGRPHENRCPVTSASGWPARRPADVPATTTTPAGIPAFGCNVPTI